MDAQGRDGQAVSRSAQALLSIVFAQALYSMGGERSPEPFYRRALGLLDETTVYIPDVAALQAVLLLASFQQNTQRSMESWAPHYRAVRAAYQLGIHAPATYEHLGTRDREIRSRLWFAVVNQDRILTAGLARPCLIPLQHVRMELADFLGPLSPSSIADTSCSKESLIYFHHVIALHEIFGVTVDSIYGSNISSSERLTLEDLVAKTISLSGKLEQWREGIAPPGIVSADADMSTWTATAFETERYPLLLSIYHNRAMMLLHGSLLMRVLGRVMSSGHDPFSGAVQDAALSLLSNYLRILKHWLHLINGVLRHGRAFLDQNAIWWTSNYMRRSLPPCAFDMRADGLAVLSTCIHLSAFWLLSISLKSSMKILSVHPQDVEGLLKGSLDTMKLLGGYQHHEPQGPPLSRTTRAVAEKHAPISW